MRKPAVTATERLYRIVEDGMCIGCGLCESIAGREAVQMHTAQTGYERPLVVGELGQETVDEIYDVCPGLRLDSLPDRLIDADTIIDPVWGPYKYMVSAHATDEGTRTKAASGGVLTALCKYLIDTRRVDFILHARPSTRDVTFGDAHISLTTRDVEDGTGSVYGPTAPLKDIRAILDRGQPFAFVGKPCDISALRNYAKF
ncbi:MAG: coenzyme F420 hydrogenase/dehydrogenase beta subunit N-terminal domain-containing protein, partial [Paracoccaceae bacterium]|nr:coenzyme F420 hydrogenase/dehydrogenase beta subunit N-terminal domain-containing protein [Paracoccaceae bacterium]